MEEHEALAIHAAIHDPNATDVLFRGTRIPVALNKQGVRYCNVLGTPYVHAVALSCSSSNALANLGSCHKI